MAKWTNGSLEGLRNREVVWKARRKEEGSGDHQDLALGEDLETGVLDVMGVLIPTERVLNHSSKTDVGHAGLGGGELMRGDVGRSNSSRFLTSRGIGPEGGTWRSRGRSERDMVRARGEKRSVPSLEVGSEVGVGEGQVDYRRSSRVPEGKIDVHTGLVQEGEVVV